MTLELPEPYTTEFSGTGVRYPAGCLLPPSSSRQTNLRPPASTFHALLQLRVRPKHDHLCFTALAPATLKVCTDDICAPVSVTSAGGRDVRLLQQPGPHLRAHQQPRQRTQLRAQKAHLRMHTHTHLHPAGAAAPLRLLCNLHPPMLL